MAIVCDNLLTKEIDINCDDPISAGIEAKGVIINRSQIDFASCTINADRNNVVESLVLSDGAKGYSIVQQGTSPYTGTQIELVVGTYRNTFTNTTVFVVFNNDPDVCREIIDKLANGEFVVILENKYKGMNKEENPGDGAYQIYGWYQGLKASELTNEKYSEDTEGGWLVTMIEENAPKSGMFLFNTDYETTKQLFESLTA